MKSIKMVLPPTSKRVCFQTKPKYNTKIRNQTIGGLSNYTNANVAELTDKLKKLDTEWDTERVLEANAATFILTGTLLGVVSSKAWFVFSGIVGGFLLHHSLSGWCPPICVIRRMGIRTAEEINQEKMVLKFLRGDFKMENKNVEEMLKRAER